MKGPSLERQYNIIQEQIKKKIDNYNSKRLNYNFPDLEEKLIEGFQKFDVQECDYLYDPQFPVGMGVGHIRYSRWELYKFNEEKFQICKIKNQKNLIVENVNLVGYVILMGIIKFHVIIL